MSTLAESRLPLECEGVELSEPGVSRICAIINPRSGRWQRGAYARHDPADLVARWLAPDRSSRPAIKVMHGAKDGIKLTREALGEGYDTVVAVGGDGTINDVIQALCGAPDGIAARLGLIPMGTANVLARILELPLHDPEAAGEIIRAGHSRQIDLGRANGQWFALVAGIGFDGAVTQQIDQRWKRVFGKLTYLMAAAKVAGSFPPAQISLELDGAPPQEFNAFLVLIANGGRYAGNFSLGQEVRLDDGVLDLFVCLRRDPLLLALINSGSALLRDRLDRAPGVIHLRARRVRVNSDRPLVLQLDGDAVRSTPVEVEIVPSALRVLSAF